MCALAYMLLLHTHTCIFISTRETVFLGFFSLLACALLLPCPTIIIFFPSTLMSNGTCPRKTLSMSLCVCICASISPLLSLCSIQAFCFPAVMLLSSSTHFHECKQKQGHTHKRMVNVEHENVCKGYQPSPPPGQQQSKKTKKMC